MIWEPFLLALVLGLIVSAGLYFAYLWPSVEPAPEPAAEPAAEPPAPEAAPAEAGSTAAAPPDEAAST